jgi:peptidoglycan/LPS O-acetylase OafA/YrhL
VTDTVRTDPAPPAVRSWRTLGSIPGLDGLRGIAVLLVMMTHLQFLVPYGVTGIGSVDRFIGGGYLGVDLFFVLSGFLITALLLSELDATSDVRFGAFYARRALRLLPALYVMLAIHYVYAQWAGQNLHQERSTIIAAVFYVANWQWEFRPFTVNRDLGLLWSLSIEEQFYLVWPALLVALLGARRNLKAVTIAIVTGVVAVTVWRAHLWSIGTWWQRLAVRTDTRVDALLVGALLAVLWIGGNTPRRYVKEAAWLGVAFGLWFVATSSAEDAFGYKGGLTIFAFANAAIILAVLNGGWAGTRFLQLAPLRAVGRVSYGLYLWHFPIFWAVTVEGAEWSNLERVVAAFSLTALFTLASWYFIEQPALRYKRRYEVRRQRGKPRAGSTTVVTGAPAPASPERSPRRAWALGVGIVALVAVCLPFTLFADDPPSNTFAQPDGLAFPSGDVERSGYWGLLDLDPTFKDPFDGSVAPIGTAADAGDQGWQVVSGTWTVDDGRAATAPGGGPAARIALAPQTTNDGLVEVNLDVPAVGAGLVFRYANPSNFWAITADPDTLTWSVVQRVDGADTAVTSFVAPVFHQVTVTVTLSGETIRFLVNGVERGRVLDPAPLTLLRSGLIELGSESGTARWDRFLLMAPDAPDDGGP